MYQTIIDFNILVFDDCFTAFSFFQAVQGTGMAALDLAQVTLRTYIYIYIYMYRHTIIQTSAIPKPMLVFSRIRNIKKV